MSGSMYFSRLFKLLVNINLLLLTFAIGTARADLNEIKERGVLRHLGVPYTSFVTGSGDGLDVELIQKFSAYLGVRYEYVETSWGTVIGDLSGRQVKVLGENVEVLADVPVKGDIAATGMTVLPWREKVVDFSMPTFPSPVWVIAPFDSSIKPITPTGSIEDDIAAVKGLMKNTTILGKQGTCLDPYLFRLETNGAVIKMYGGGINELAPAIMKGEADVALLDAPDALIALKKWPGKLKVIGPVSDKVYMATAFAKTSPMLREAFDRFFEKCWKDGTYRNLVEKYYPEMLEYSSDFFTKD
jgi:ABC-type amino acid transport substrate-binding protein